MNATTDTNIEALAIVNVPGGRWAYCAVKRYRAVARQDGVKTWRAVETVSREFRSTALAGREAADIGAQMGLPVLDIRHGAIVIIEAG